MVSTETTIKVTNNSTIDPNRKTIGNKCGCKGIRKCAICHPELLNQTNHTSGSIFPPEDSSPESTLFYVYCTACTRGRFHAFNQVVRDKLERFVRDQTKFECICGDGNDDPSSSVRVEGVFVKPEFLSADEEAYLVEQIDTQNSWVESQSGRFKQDFGPKANFNKRKLKYSTFTGLPNYSKSLISRISDEISILDDFVCIDLCNLKYDSSRAACIDPHYDDMWLWGERLITVNLISNTFLTLHPGKEMVASAQDMSRVQVLVPMERRSLLVLSGDARYKWLHAIKKEHIVGERWAITLREASDEYRTGELGVKIERLAKTYSGVSVGTIEEFFKIAQDEEAAESRNESKVENMRKHLEDTSSLLAKFGLSEPSEIVYTSENTARIKAGHDEQTGLVVVYVDDNKIWEALSRLDQIGFLSSLTNDRFLCHSENLLVWLETNNNNNVISNDKLLFDEQQLFEIGKFVSEFAKFSQQTFGKVNDQKVVQDFIFSKPLSIVNHFDRSKRMLQTILKDLNMDLGQKSKFVATIYNIRRLHEEQNSSLTIGYVLGDFDAAKFHHHQSKNSKNLRLKSHLSNIHISFVLDDLAMFFVSYLIFQNESWSLCDDKKEIINKSLRRLVDGYQSASENEKLSHSDLELLKFLILFHLQVRIMNLPNEKRSGDSKLEQFYEFVFDFDTSTLI